MVKRGAGEAKRRERQINGAEKAWVEHDVWLLSSLFFACSKDGNLVCVVGEGGPNSQLTHGAIVNVSG